MFDTNNTDISPLIHILHLFFLPTIQFYLYLNEYIKIKRIIKISSGKLWVNLLGIPRGIKGIRNFYGVVWTQRWRRKRDSNPRWACTHAAFRVRCIQPLCHLSAGRVGRCRRGRTHSDCRGVRQEQTGRSFLLSSF